MRDLYFFIWEWVLVLWQNRISFENVPLFLLWLFFWGASHFLLGNVHFSLVMRKLALSTTPTALLVTLVHSYTFNILCWYILGAFVWDQSGIRIIGIMQVSVCLGAILIPEYLNFHSGYSSPMSRIAGIYSYSGISQMNAPFIFSSLEKGLE